MGIKSSITCSKHAIYEKTLFLVCVGCILTIRLWHLSELYGPFVMWDEAGYWSHAANLAGMSWTKVLTSWYSYGYSFLLAPLFCLTHDMVLLYRMAIVENAILGAVGFVLGIKIIEFIQPDCDRIAATVISFIAASYSAYTFQSQIAWSETFVYVFFWLVLYACMEFLKKTDGIHAFLFSLSVGCLYVIHNRTLPIIVALALLIMLLLVKKRICLREIGIIVITLTALLVIDHYTKIGLSNLMWGVPDGFNGNDISSQKNNIWLFLSLEGIKKLVVSLSGKVWYLLVSTLLLGFGGIVYILRSLLESGKNKERQAEGFFLFFILMCVLGTIAVSAIAMNGVIARRLDYLFYGRYTDMVSGILIVLGLLCLRKCSFQCRYVLGATMAIFVTAGTAAVIFRQIQQLDQISINKVNVPGLYFQSEFNVQSMTITAAILFCMIFLAACFTQKEYQKIRKTAYLLEMILCFAAFCVVSNHAYSICIRASQENLEKKRPLYDILNMHSEFAVYVDSDDVAYQSNLRMRVTENEMYFTAPDESAGNYFLVTKNTADTGSYEDDEFYIVNVSSPSVVRVKGEELAGQLRQEGYALFKNQSQLTYEDVDIECRKDAIMPSTGGNFEVEVQFMCEADKIFHNSNNYYLSYHVYDTKGDCLKWDGTRTAFSNVYNEKTVTLSISDPLFEKPGNYILKIDVVEEGVTWLSSKGLEMEEILIVVD